ncbi:MAG: recombination mediator RecR [Marinifilaceae bacterium]|jgi:recombination protein RecR|nr:recombination mediator RecR [Marinifilaceae bacterium]
MKFESTSSKLLDDAVEEFAKLPGIGRKTALRLALFQLQRESEEVNMFCKSIFDLKDKIKKCKICHNICETEICEICSNSSRDETLICVVESIKDIMSIERTQQFNGLYHVLGGVISPMDGIGPSDLNIKELMGRIEDNNIKEIIFALSPTMEGDTTNFYLYKKLAKYDVDITSIARGISIGDELEYTDEVTLGKSIMLRTPFDDERL